MPHHRRGGGEDRLAEVVLQNLKHGQSRHPGTAEEHSLGVRPVRLPSADRVGSRRRFLINVADPFQPSHAHHVKTMLRQMGSALFCQFGIVWRGVSDPFLRPEARQGLQDAAERGHEAGAGGGFLAADQFCLGLAAERIAGRGVAPGR